MRIGALAGAVAIAAAALMGGCANDGNIMGGLTTASVTPGPEAAMVAKAEPKVDPQCAALVTKIDALRKEGTPERLEKVSTGKGTTAQVKRQSLAKMTELDKANAEYQARCSKLTPAQQAALQSKPAEAAAASNADAKAEQIKQQATQAAKQKTTQTIAKKAKTSAAKAVTKTAAAAAPAPAASAAAAAAPAAAPVAKAMASEGVTVSVPPAAAKAE